MLDYMPACRGVKRLSAQGHRLRLSVSSTAGLCVCVYLSVPLRAQFTVLQLTATDSGRYGLDHVSTLFSSQVCVGGGVGASAQLLQLCVNKGVCVSQETLVDFTLTSTDIWGLWVDDGTVIRSISFDQ